MLYEGPVTRPIDTFRYIANVCKAARDVGIDIELAMRFLAELSLLTEADQKCAVQPPERTQ
jgi:hypothetical protein